MRVLAITAFIRKDYKMKKHYENPTAELLFPATEEIMEKAIILPSNDDGGVTLPPDEF